MSPLFKDTALQDRFDRMGYAIVPLLSEEQVNRLKELYYRQILQDTVTGLYESSRQNSYDVNRLISDAIQEEMKGPAGEIFLPSDLYGGTFMVKSHRESGMLPLHQDWSVVEEDLFNTVFIWCPLEDVGPQNGGLFLLEGSHRYFNVIRSGSYPSNRYKLPVQLHRFTKNIHLKAGEAIFYSDKLFHGSYANNGVADRIVVTARVMEKDAPLVYFQKQDDQTVDVYNVDSAFYLTHIDSIAKGRMPTGMQKAYSRSYRHVEITNASLQEKIREHFPPSVKQPCSKGRLFKDPQLGEAFDRDGYVVLDLISEEKVEILRRFYAQLEQAPTPQHGFQVSLDNQSSAFVQTVSEKLLNTVRDDVDKHFRDHQLFTASFVVKEKNPMGVVPPHQDWTFVDEEQYWSATIWCPLVDVTMENGGLGVIRGSHRFYDHVRPSPSPQYEPPFKDQLAAIFPYLQIINLKAGQALMFNNQTIHGSPPNLSDQTRISFGIGITYKNARIRHFYKLPASEENLIEGFDVEPDFFYHYNNARLSALYQKGERPKGLRSIGEFHYACKEYSTEELTQKFEEAGNKKDDLLLKKMAALYGYSLDKKALPNGASAVTQKQPFWKVYTPLNVYREIRFRMAKVHAAERPLWKVYTPRNIVREIRHRMIKR